MFLKEKMIFKYEKYYLRAWRLCIKELHKFEKISYNKVSDEELLNSLILKYGVFSMKALLIDLLSLKKENINSLYMLTEAYTLLVLLYLDMQETRKQFKRKKYNVKTSNKEYDEISSILEQTMPYESINKIALRNFTDKDIDICESFYSKNIIELEQVLKK